MTCSNRSGPRQGVEGGGWGMRTAHVSGRVSHQYRRLELPGSGGTSGPFKHLTGETAVRRSWTGLICVLQIRMDKAPRYKEERRSKGGLLCACGAFRHFKITANLPTIKVKDRMASRGNAATHTPRTSQQPFGCGPSRRSSPLWSWCKSRTSRGLAGRR